MPGPSLRLTLRAVSAASSVHSFRHSPVSRRGCYRIVNRRCCSRAILQPSPQDLQTRLQDRRLRLSSEGRNLPHRTGKFVRLNSRSSNRSGGMSLATRKLVIGPGSAIGDHSETNRPATPPNTSSGRCNSRHHEHSQHPCRYACPCRALASRTPRGICKDVKGNP
jgi:hypothetical protein